MIREAMRKAGKVALGRLVMHQRERLMALEAAGLAASSPTSRATRGEGPAELSSADLEVKADPQDDRHRRRRSSSSWKGRFDPSEFNDRYEAAPYG